jgi:hypothetical protein
LDYVHEKEQKVVTKSATAKNMQNVLHIPITNNTPIQPGKYKKQFQTFPQYNTNTPVNTIMPPQQNSPMAYPQLMIQPAHDSPGQVDEPITSSEEELDMQNGDLGLMNNMAYYNNLTPRTVAEVENMNQTFRMASQQGATFVFEQESSKPNPSQSYATPASPQLIQPQVSPMYNNQNFFNEAPKRERSPPQLFQPQIQYEGVHAPQSFEILGKRKFEQESPQRQFPIRNQTFYPFNGQSFIQTEPSGLQYVEEPNVAIPRIITQDDSEASPLKKRKIAYETLRITLPEDEEDSGTDQQDVPSHLTTTGSDASSNVSLTCTSLTSSPRFPLNTNLNSFSPLHAIGANLPRLPIPFDGEKDITRANYLLSPSLAFSPSNHGILTLMGVGSDQDENRDKGLPTPRALDNANTPMSISDDSNAVNEGFKLAAAQWSQQQI